MNIFCQLGMHDWYILDSVSKILIGAGLLRPSETEGSGEPPPPLPQVRFSEMVHDSICLECGKRNNQIERTRNLYESAAAREMVRKKKAESLGSGQQAVSTLIDHESRISVNESDKANTRDSLQRIEANSQRIEAKLDRLIEKK